MSRPTLKKKTDKWSSRALYQMLDWYNSPYIESYVGCLLARTDDETLKEIKNTPREYPEYIRRAAKMELLLRKAERRAKRIGSFKIY